MKNLFDLPKEEARVEISLGSRPRRVYMQRIALGVNDVYFVRIVR